MREDAAVREFSLHPNSAFRTKPNAKRLLGFSTIEVFIEKVRIFLINTFFILYGAIYEDFDFR
ncbi:hypothetical protein JHD46_03785 [Sulfurimonas sp. SAG-AH-194-C20]|nr:hypothetical protein [Sulfurimonas sp. SAG-AH-194-C20]MDF1878756.1 hypothetical protein [Sulfurimonas sp. SAG-AH-194-C20]